MNLTFSKAFCWLLLIPIVLMVGCSPPAKNSTLRNFPGILTLESSPEIGAESISLTLDPKKQPVAVWTEKAMDSNQIQVLYSRWNGQELSDPQTVPMSETPKVGSESIPKMIFKPDGDLLLFYEVKIHNPTNDRVSQIKYMVSKDDGKTWSGPFRVHSDNSPDKGHSFFDIALLSDGEIGAVWLDTALIEGGRSVLFSKTDIQNKFGNESVVDSLACQCCRTALYADASGLISVVYRDILPGSIRDISLATSLNGGASFSTAISFSFDQWNLDGCPHNGPDVVSDGERIYTTWYTGANQNGVYFAELNTKGKTINKERLSPNGRNIQLSLIQGKPVVIYSESVSENGEKNSRILSKDMTTGEIIQLSAPGSKVNSPVSLATDSGMVISGWLDHSGKIQKARVTFLSPVSTDTLH
ncbi:sialidase family protein [Algoriphagus yeomjeoni]|uniref:sialidase family protein n=1 Tax=Algoriphagus yeomjeoni TaxID=291403 RepID=UPI003CE5ACD8